MSTLRLLIDAGNTRIKWTLVDARASAHDVAQSAAVSACVHRETGWHQTLVDDWERALNGRTNLASAWLANVAGDTVAAPLQAALAQLAPHAELRPLSPAAQAAGIVNGYAEPDRLGVDRWLSALGARALYPEETLLVVSLGTATTIDAVIGERFDGGVILPGLDLMRAALAANTAQLPHPEAAAQAGIGFAGNTDDAIRNGCTLAQVGAIATAWQQLQQQAPQRSRRCIISGGAAAAPAPLLPLPSSRHDHLVLAGIQALANDAGA